MSDDDLCLLCGHERAYHYGDELCDCAFETETEGVPDCDCSGFLDPETC